MDWQMTLFQTLTQAPGVPGFEQPVRAIMRDYLGQSSQHLLEDHLGSIFGVHNGDTAGPKIMVAGHMDEVGFMVTQIDDAGFIHFQPLGGWWSQVLLAQRVEIITDYGAIPGVIGSTPPHLLSMDVRKKPVDMKKMFIDIGADNKQDARRIGVRPGQPIVPVCPFQVMANEKKLLAKAWDNRYGCALAIELSRELQQQKHPNVVYSGATVQEEVGLRGAATAAQLLSPDLFLALDASPAGGDIPHTKEEFGRIGDGVLLRILDKSMITHPGLRDYVLDTCETEKIKYQYYVSQGGTDAGRVHLSAKGVPSIVIGIAARYIHSHASIIHHDDYEQAKRLLITLIKNLDIKTLEQIKER
jgi:putative aminopeptidase FrvX